MSAIAGTLDDFWTKVLQNLGFRRVRVGIHCAPPSVGVMGRVLVCWVACGWVGKHEKSTHTKSKTKTNVLKKQAYYDSSKLRTSVRPTVYLISNASDNLTIDNSTLPD